jgi:hypothetical protein
MDSATNGLCAQVPDRIPRSPSIKPKLPNQTATGGRLEPASRTDEPEFALTLPTLFGTMRQSRSME